MELGNIKARNVVFGQCFFYGVYVITSDVTTLDGRTTITGWDTGTNKSVKLQIGANDLLQSIGFPDDAKEWMVTGVTRVQFKSIEFILGRVDSSLDVEKSSSLFYIFKTKEQFNDKSLLHYEILRLYWDGLKSGKTLYISLCTFRDKERIVSWRVVPSGAEVAPSGAEVVPAGAEEAPSGAEVATAGAEVPIY